MHFLLQGKSCCPCSWESSQETVSSQQPLRDCCYYTETPGPRSCPSAIIEMDQRHAHFGPMGDNSERSILASEVHLESLLLSVLPCSSISPPAQLSPTHPPSTHRAQPNKHVIIKLYSRVFLDNSTCNTRWTSDNLQMRNFFFF